MTRKQKLDSIKECYPENLHWLVDEIIEMWEGQQDEGVVLPFTSPEFIEKWNVWKEYRKQEHRFNFKSKASQQGALQKLARLSKNDEKKAIEIILQSIENGWKGFFEIKDNGKQKESVNDDYKRRVLGDLFSNE